MTYKAQNVIIITTKESKPKGGEVYFMFNTIILKKGEARLTRGEFKNFEKGDTIFGCDSEPEELKRWGIDQKEEALKEFEKYTCSYRRPLELYNIEEYALEYCECDEDGEFISGSNYDLAEEKAE